MAELGSTVAPLGFFIASPGSLAPPSPLLADNIDPKTRDFRSLFTGVDPVDDQVQVAVTTIRGSGSSVLDTGISTPVRKLLSDTNNRIAGDMRLALARQVVNRDIQIVDITFGIEGFPASAGTTDEATQSAQVNVQYRNLRALDPTVRTLQLDPVVVFQVV